MAVKIRKQRRYGGRKDSGTTENCNGRKRFCERECGRPLPCRGRAGSARWIPRSRRNA